MGTEPSGQSSSHSATVGSETFVEITDNNTTHARPKGVYVGVAGSYDFNDGEAWVKFTAAVAGSTLPIRPKGVRKNGGGGAPDAGDIVFLY